MSTHLMPAEVADVPHLSPADLADRTRVSAATVYRWRCAGTGPPYMRLGRHVRYRLVDVIAWEDARRIARWAP